MKLSKQIYKKKYLINLSQENLHFLRVNNVKKKEIKVHKT